MNYYGRFLTNFASILAPLYRLLRKHARWMWKTEHESAFQKIKDQLKSDAVLMHFDPSKPLILACDASPYGVGAVLSHRLTNDVERPIAFASRTLAPTEVKYAQLDKEGLAIIFGLKKFHHYLHGKHFIVYTDHKPLTHIFNPARAIPVMASACIQRCALTIGAYDYEIQFKPGPQQAHADACSRLPLPEVPSTVPAPGDTILLMNHFNSTPVTAAMISRWTQRSPLLATVTQYVLHGWPSKPDNDDQRPYFNRRQELSVDDNCLLWGTRVVIPPQVRNLLLDELHVGHLGIEQMKRLARSYLWWPGLDTEIESKVKPCVACQSNRKMPATAPLHPWEWPHRPWSRVHIDYAGLFLGRMFLLIVDSHSKWLDVHVTSSSTAAVTIDKLQTTFATLGLPEVLVSDNGSAFCSDEFQVFLKTNGIKHVLTPPYHPASNGLAERYVQTFKVRLSDTTVLAIYRDILKVSISRYFVINYRDTMPVHYCH